jgi:hydroxymethylpyrimidine pyrophosphatase-like HAD family hydrolase
MQRIKAVVLDLDGTLLDSRKQVSTGNLQAVRDCRSKGIHIIIATARPPGSVRRLLPAELLMGLGWNVYYNGALVADEAPGLMNINLYPPVQREKYTNSFEARMKKYTFVLR